MTTRRQIPKKAIDDLLVKSKRRCALCYMIHGDTTPKIGDIAHIEPISHGGKSTADNLIFLCAQHHAEIDRAGGSARTVAEIKTARDKLYDAISKESEEPQATGRKVFIIHGHDEQTRDELAHFLNERGLAPIILNEQPSFGMTILEKIERNADADYAIAILSPDDAGCRARQNVILELGFFLGRLGRRRVCALVSPGVDIPSDIHGMLYIEKDDHGRWKHVLTRELMDAGVPLARPQ